METGDLDFLTQMVGTLEDAVKKMEIFYNAKNYEEFNKSKKLIFQIQKKISEVLNE